MHTKKRPYHHGDLRSKLLKVTTRLVAEKGVENVTMRELAQRCGVSRTAPYRHFENKTALLAAVAEDGFKRLRTICQNARESVSDNVIANLQNVFIAYVEFAIENPTYYRLMFGPEIRELLDQPELAATAQATYNELLVVVKIGQEAHWLQPGTTDKVANVAWALAHGMASLIIDGNIKPSDDIRTMAAFACQSLVEGIRQD